MRRCVLAGFLVLCLAGCTGPVRSDNVYESKAGTTAAAVESAVETARLAVGAAAGGRAFGRTTAQTLAEASQEAESAAGTFGAIQPPGQRSDQLRDELEALTDPAVDILSDLRVAARRGDTTSLVRVAAPLGDLSDKLDAFAEAHG
jgi:hypothetical protein